MAGRTPAVGSGDAINNNSRHVAEHGGYAELLEKPVPEDPGTFLEPLAVQCTWNRVHCARTSSLRSALLLASTAPLGIIGGF